MEKFVHRSSAQGIARIDGKLRHPQLTRNDLPIHGKGKSMQNTKPHFGPPAAPARRVPGRPLFAPVFTGLAFAAPIVLLSYAGLAVPEALARAQLVVLGSEGIVMALGAALLARALYAFALAGSAPARAASRRLPDLRIGPGAFTA